MSPPTTGGKDEYVFSVLYLMIVHVATAKKYKRSFFNETRILLSLKKIKKLPTLIIYTNTNNFEYCQFIIIHGVPIFVIIFLFFVYH